MKQKPQLFFIHGGMTFKNRHDYLSYLKNRDVALHKSKKWSRDYFKRELKRYFEVVMPDMPLKEDAKYEDWKIHFEKFFPFLKDGIVLVGYSLGGIFLAKYLSENKFPKVIRSVYFIAAPFDNTLEDEDLVGGFELKEDLSLISENCNKITFMFSKDDPVVPLSHAERYREKLKSAKIEIYEGKNGHFGVPKFPELVRSIKSDIK